MPRGTTQSGRTRLVITVVLAVLIGAVGAFLLPVLIHEAKPPTPTTFRAEVGFIVPAEGLPRGAALRVLAAVPGHEPLVATEPMPANASAKAVVGLVADGIVDAAWPEAARPRLVGETLSFTGLTAIGGDPGRSGVPLTLSVSGRPGQSLTLRLKLTTGPGSDSESARARVALTARGVVGPEGTTAVSASETTDWTRPGDALRALTEKLHQAGWLTGVGTGQGGGLAEGLLVMALPDHSEVGSAILTVEYDGAPDPPCVWSIELVP